MNSNNNAFYINRIIKLISPITCQTFKIELNGEENELRKLLGTILEINPKSIKGLRDSYNNYYTLSSAVKNPHINTDPYNYYTVVIKGLAPSNNIKYLKYPSFNILKRDRINSYSLSSDSNNDLRNNLINKSLNYLGNEEDDSTNTFRYLYPNIEHKFEKSDYYKTKLLNFANDLYRKNYIDHSLERKLRKLINEKNKEVLSILNPYLNLQSQKSFDELAKKIKPVLKTKKSENIEESKQNSSSSSSSKNSNSESKKEKKSKKKRNKSKKKTIKKQEKISNEEKILEDIKLNFTKEKYAQLKGLLEKKDKEIIKIIKGFEKNNDYNHLLSKLSRLVENNSDMENGEDNISENENDSSYYIRKGDSEKSSNKKSKNKNKLDIEGIQKVSKNIYNSLKNKGKDLYYIAKYDLEKLKNDEKISLFSKQFKLDLEKLKKDNYKIPKKSISLIKNYYSDYIIKKVCKNFTENEKLIYEHLMAEDEEKNILLQHFKELLTHQNLNDLSKQIKDIIKEEEERIQEEENEDDDEENKGKNSIKEENEENEDEEEEEEEDGEGEEDEDGEEEDEDNKDSEKKSKNSSSNKDNFILKDDNKDRVVNLLNNNYRKINNFNQFANKNNNNEEKDNNNKENTNDNNKDKDDEKKDNKDDIQNLGLGFVVVKPKKTNKQEEKKESNKNLSDNNDDNNKIIINKLNTTKSVAKESSQSTNNPNKKLNQFITQIEHLKKIDDIKKTIIDAIHNNNKYVMDLFQKFQKNKFTLNPKSLYSVYKQIKDNPEKDSKDYIFQSLIKESTNIDENIKEFLIEEFSNNNSKLEQFYSLYEPNKDKNEFFKNIENFMEDPDTKKSLIQYNLKKIKSEISSNLLKKDENDNNEVLVSKSKEIIKIFQKYNLFNEKQYNIIMNTFEKDDSVFTATVQALFDQQDLNDFYETLTLFLDKYQKYEISVKII